MAGQADERRYALDYAPTPTHPLSRERRCGSTAIQDFADGMVMVGVVAHHAFEVGE